MSGIPVYSQSPINVATADGIGPKTAAVPPGEGVRSKPSANTATTTAIPSSTTAYPAARPGAPAVPAPTSVAQRYAPPTQPTRTAKLEDEGPAPPQPGAIPAPLNNFRSNLPPPPKMGEKFSPPNPQISMPQPYPPQMSIPPPTNVYGAQLPTSSTSVTTTSLSSYPVALKSENHEAPRRSLEHPPGYVQNPYASNSSAQERRSQDAQNSGGLGAYEHEKPSTTAAFGVDPEGVWNTAKIWATTAGKKLSEVESEVWKRVNGGK